MNNKTYMDDEYRLRKLLDFLYDEVRSAGGDGDAMLYLSYFDFDWVMEIVMHWNANLEHRWNFMRDGDIMTLYDNQEGIIITKDKNVYDNRPDWQQISIEW